MAWIESHQSLKDHPKTRRLARRLGISVPAAIGHLHCLWWWALEYAQDGSLAQYDADDIADAMMWDGDSQQLIQALVDAGFLDEAEDGLRIHDWEDYAGRLLEQRRKAAERARKHREQYAQRMRNVRVRNAPTKTITETETENNPPPPLRGASPHGGDARPANSGATNPPDDQGGRVRRMIPHEAIKDAWNEICGAAGLPRVQVLSAKRRQYLTARCTELARYFGEQVYTVDWWRGVFHRVRGSPFCMGAGGRGWRATFDWLIERREAVVRLLEGHYDRVDEAKTAFERTREQFQPGRTDEDFAGWRKRGGGST